MGGGKEKKRAGIDGCFLRKSCSILEEVHTVLLVLFLCAVMIVVVSSSTCVTILLQVCSNVLLSVIPW